uniref:Purple acid phosphatase N-terminal domain-containing protein n=1 Tax=Picea sitchensis TaxID=3332 RepID=D5ACP9_PICSI|nr:unknown [Picea sitchensis]
MGRRTKFEEELIIAFVVVVSLMIGAANGLLTVESSPKTLNRSGDNVTLTLTWTANSSSSSSDMDWLGIYNPPDSADEHFIGYILLSSFCPNWMEGSCYVDLPLINLRRPYEFRVFRWDKSEISNRTPVDEAHNPLPSTTHLLARSDGVSFRNLNDPAQLHLAFTSNQDEMRVMFLTKDAIKSSVRYGLDENEMDRVAEARSVTYTRSEMCDAPANTSLGWMDPGYIHDAVMQGLEPGKRYFYQELILHFPYLLRPAKVCYRFCPLTARVFFFHSCGGAVGEGLKLLCYRFEFKKFPTQRVFYFILFTFFLSGAR